MLTPVMDMWNRIGPLGVSVLVAQSVIALVVAVRLPLILERSPVAQPDAPSAGTGPRLLRWLLAGLPPLYMPVACGAALVGRPLPHLDRSALGQIYSAEFAAFAFTFCIGVLVFTAAFAPPGRIRFVAGYLGACGVAFFVGLIGEQTKGELVLPFVTALFATYGGLLTRVRDARADVQILLRVLVSAGAFIVLLIVFGIAAGLPEAVDEWPNRPAGLVFGLTYFLVLARCEFWGLYDRASSRRPGHWPTQASDSRALAPIIQRRPRS